MTYLKGMPEKFRIELEDMSYLYGTIQELRLFKDNFDALLLNKCPRNTIGRISGYYNWPEVSDYIIQELKERTPSMDEPFSIDIRPLAALANSNEFTVYCGQVSHVPTIEVPYWQLSFSEGD